MALNISKKNHTDAQIECVLPTTAVVVRANHTLLTQAFENLIINAVLYADPSHPLIRIALKDDGDAWLFVVENNGPFIPLDEQPQLCTRFFRGSNARSLNKEGSGLGLYIVKAICDRYGWSLSYQSPNEPV